MSWLGTMGAGNATALATSSRYAAAAAAPLRCAPARAAANGLTGSS